MPSLKPLSPSPPSPTPSPSPSPPSKTTLSDLPHDVIILIGKTLQNTDLVCLALACHRFYTAILAATRRTKLSQLSLYFAFDYKETVVERLRSWVPAEYVLCEVWRCKYVKRGVVEEGEDDGNGKGGQREKVMCDGCKFLGKQRAGQEGGVVRRRKKTSVKVEVKRLTRSRAREGV